MGCLKYWGCFEQLRSDNWPELQHILLRTLAVTRKTFLTNVCKRDVEKIENFLGVTKQNRCGNCVSRMGFIYKQAKWKEKGKIKRVFVVYHNGTTYYFK